jgi:hypothetical protein
VIKTRPVVDDEHRQSHPTIAFRPRDQRFAVSDAIPAPQSTCDIFQLLPSRVCIAGAGRSKPHPNARYATRAEVLGSFWQFGPGRGDRTGDH